VLDRRTSRSSRHRLEKENLLMSVVAGLLLGAGTVNAADSAFPGNADEGSTRLPALSTYADRYRYIQGTEIHAGVRAAGSGFPSSNATD
jgi:hypothetical protein